MCEVVEISDDEDPLMPENDVRIMPKDESSNYDFPPLDACSRPGVLQTFYRTMWQAHLEST